MATTISVRVEDKTLTEINKVERKWQTDRSEAIRRLLVDSLRQWKINNALEELRKQSISIGKAAEECNIPLWEMLDLVKEKNIDWTGYSEEDLEKDLAVLQ
tara:strand:+ start:1404 stop:1706 length:303 start_codon:yes stop_codon:yes gene_type:complete